MTREEVVDRFFMAAGEGKLPVAVVGERGLVVGVATINTIQGTFLARSSDKRARALAAIMAAEDTHRMTQRSVLWQ